MEERDVERILRDVVITQGLRVTIVRVQRLTGGWVVTVTDQDDRIVSRRFSDGPAAAIRTALLNWLETQS